MPQALPDESETLSPLQLPGLVVTPEWLAYHMAYPLLRLLDVRDRESYDAGHIPNAVWMGLESLNEEVRGVPGMLLSPERFAETMELLGVAHDNVVVVYDDNWGLPAARVLWSLARYGHSHTAVLTGGWDAWQEEGRAQSQVPYTPPRTQFTIRLADEHVAGRTWLLERLDDPDLVVVDTRSQGEYDQGHLPGAICWDWMNGVPVDGWDTLRPAAELCSELVAQGITPDKEIVTYCYTGVRAAHTYLLLRSLGYSKVRNYDGSWLEWSHTVSTERKGGAH